MICRDVYGKHPDELTEDQHRYLLEFIALAVIEQEDLK